MQVIKVFLLLTFGLWADFKLDVPTGVSNEILEKTLVSFNNDIQKNVSIYSLNNTILSMQIILDNINCSTVEMENTIQDNLFTTISWNKAIRKRERKLYKNCDICSKTRGSSTKNSKY